MRLRTANTHARRRERRAAKARAYAVWERCAARMAATGSMKGLRRSGYTRRDAKRMKAWRKERTAAALAEWRRLNPEITAMWTTIAKETDQ